MRVRKMTIILVVYNDLRLARALDSVLSQRVGCKVEVIVVTDETGDALELVLHAYDMHIAVIRNTNRVGMYRARNQGLAASSGDVIGFLNADDYYHDDQVLADVLEAFESRDDLDLLSGNWKYVKLTGEVMHHKTARWNHEDRDWSGHNWVLDGFPFSDCTLFHSRASFSRLGVHDESFRFAGYSELLTRFFLCGVSHVHLDRYITVFYEGGMSSDGRFTTKFKTYAEFRQIHKSYGVHPLVSYSRLGYRLARWLAAKYVLVHISPRYKGVLKRFVEKIIPIEKSI